MRSILRSLLFSAVLLSGFLLLTYAYLYPGSEALVERRLDTVLSDNTDGVAMPYAYERIIHIWHEHPTRFLFGSIYDERAEPEHGAGYWFPQSERWIVLLESTFLPIEQLTTGYVAALLLLNAIAIYLLARVLNWNRAVAYGLSIAWAFNCYTRARAKVHMAFVGTYHLPLIFLGLVLVTTRTSKRSVAAAALAFLVAATVAHYYLVTTIFLSPLFLIFLAVQPGTLPLRKVYTRLAIALVPALTLLACNFLLPLPSDAKVPAASITPQSGVVAAGEVHPFLRRFAAHPIDYIAGDVSLGPSVPDLNPLREIVNRYVLDHIDDSYPHERTNGIRWSILLLALFGVVALARRRFTDDPLTRRNILFFAGFALIGFWLSVSPDVPFSKAGLSYWLHAVFSQVRVPNRAGINVHFALLMLTGFVLAARSLKWQRFLLFPGAFAALMIADYPPLVQTEPLAKIEPAYEALKREHGACGAGLYFPFVNDTIAPDDLIHFVQRLRGSDCLFLNNVENVDRRQAMMTLFPPTTEFLRRLPELPAASENLERFARCLPLTWIVFDRDTPSAWMAATCQKLGWSLDRDLVCAPQDKSQQPARPLSDCL